MGQPVPSNLSRDGILNFSGAPVFGNNETDFNPILKQLARSPSHMEIKKEPLVIS